MASSDNNEIVRHIVPVDRQEHLELLAQIKQLNEKVDAIEAKLARASGIALFLKLIGGLTIGTAVILNTLNDLFGVFKR